MHELYETIASLCEQRAITGYRLCKDIGISPNTITELRKGRRSGVSATTLRKIATYFGVPVERLLGTKEWRPAAGKVGVQFSQVLSKLMEEKAWTQYRLAKSMDISQSTVAGWLSGTSMPRRATMKLLSEIFGVSVDYLLGKENAASISDGLTETKIALIAAVKLMTEEQASAMLAIAEQMCARRNDQSDS